MRKLIINSILTATLTASSFWVVAAESKAVPAEQIVASIEQSKIDINTADAEPLVRELSGIGKAKAQAIIDYREAHGPFATVDELLEVKGIGVAILEKNLNKLSVN